MTDGIPGVRAASCGPAGGHWLGCRGSPADAGYRVGPTGPGSRPRLRREHGQEPPGGDGRPPRCERSLVRSCRPPRSPASPSARAWWPAAPKRRPGHQTRPHPGAARSAGASIPTISAPQPQARAGSARPRRRPISAIAVNDRGPAGASLGSSRARGIYLSQDVPAKAPGAQARLVEVEG
jgi:hypothetical protein